MEGFGEWLRDRTLSCYQLEEATNRTSQKSQLGSFAKADDLAYFLYKIGGIQEVQGLLLAPIDAMVKAYRNEKGDWHAYKERFLDLMSERQIETSQATNV